MTAGGGNWRAADGRNFVRHKLSAWYRSLPASQRWAFREWRQRLSLLRQTAAVWRWRRVAVAAPNCTHPVVHVGTLDGAEQIRVHLAGKDATPELEEAVVWTSDAWFPGALRTPRYLQPALPLSLTLDEILDGYGDKLRRVVRQQVMNLRVLTADTDQMVQMVNETMLRPYAISRHGPGAAQLDDRVLWKIARSGEGRLEVVFNGDEAVACHVGLESVRAGKRFWSAIRYGYPATVFSDAKRLHQINSANVHLAIMSARERGFDYYNFGHCLGRPHDGLLHWKARRGGRVDVVRPQEWLYVRLPSRGAATFLWNTPLFGDGGPGRGPVLHLGLPRNKTVDDLVRRFGLTCPLGVSEIALHLDEPLDDHARAQLAQTLPAPRVTFIDPGTPRPK